MNHFHSLSGLKSMEIEDFCSWLWWITSQLTKLNAKNTRKGKWNLKKKFFLRYQRATYMAVRTYWAKNLERRKTHWRWAQPTVPHNIFSQGICILLNSMGQDVEKLSRKYQSSWAVFLTVWQVREPKTGGSDLSKQPKRGGPDTAGKGRGGKTNQTLLPFSSQSCLSMKRGHRVKS